jgi:hypothetical protein
MRREDLPRIALTGRLQVPEGRPYALVEVPRERNAALEQGEMRPDAFYKCC